MGISPGAITLLATALLPMQRAGAVLTFGVQKVEATHDEASARIARAGLEPAHLPRTTGRIKQDVLFRMLGFDAVESLDHYEADSPTHVHNLNLPIPDALRGRFALVYDGGTTEHCFAIPQVLANAMRLLALGGRVIHHLPVNNHVDHGFYQFSPCLLFDFYDANGFDELRMFLHFRARRRESYIAYDPRKDNLPYELGGRCNVLMHFSARRVRELPDVAFPIQGRYRLAFGKELSAPRSRGLPRLWQSLRKRTLRLRTRRL